MSTTPIRRKKFKIIAGGLHRKISFEPVRIVAAPENSAPFQVDALVFEEDTWLVMSANPTICEPEVHPIRLMTDVIDAEPDHFQLFEANLAHRPTENRHRNYRCAECRAQRILAHHQ